MALNKISVLTGLRRRKVLVVIAGYLFIVIAVLIAGQPVYGKPPSCETSGTTVQFLSETCVDSACRWEYKVCQTGFALSHWVLGICACLESSITEVGYVDSQGNEVVMPKCNEVEGACWSVGLDPTTGLFGLKWDDLPGPENDCWKFYFVVDQNFPEDTLDWASKYDACAPGNGTVTGPACTCMYGQIIVFKYNDLNKDGAYNDDDQTIEGWEICLDDDYRLTDENGFIDFGTLPPGTYTVCEKPRDGWTNSEPGVIPACYVVELTAGERETLYFGNYQSEPKVAYIRAAKYYDTNQDGSYDRGDFPMNGWIICLDGDCKITRNRCFLCGGCTSYWEVPPGSYRVCEIPWPGWINTEPGVDRPCQTITVEAGEIRCVKFGNWRPYPYPPVCEPTVGGTVVAEGSLAVLAPWIFLAGLVIVFTGTGVFLIRRMLKRDSSLRSE